MNKFVWVVLSVLILSGGFYFYNNKLTIGQKPGLGEDEPRESRIQANPAVEIKEFTMTAKQWAFDPAVITVKEGDKVKITVKSIDVAHGFALSEFGINENLEPGKEVVVEFTAGKKGEFSFRCSVICGQGHQGMTGKLIVE